MTKPPNRTRAMAYSPTPQDAITVSLLVGSIAFFLQLVLLLWRQ